MLCSVRDGIFHRRNVTECYKKSRKSGPVTIRGTHRSQKKTERTQSAPCFQRTLEAQAKSDEPKARRTPRSRKRQKSTKCNPLPAFSTRHSSPSRAIDGQIDIGDWVPVASVGRDAFLQCTGMWGKLRAAAPRTACHLSSGIREDSAHLHPQRIHVNIRYLGQIALPSARSRWPAMCNSDRPAGWVGHSGKLGVPSGTAASCPADAERGIVVIRKDL